MAPDVITGEKAREQRVCGQDESNREQVAAEDDGDGFEHWKNLLQGHEAPALLPSGATDRIDRGFEAGY